jgi:hypothetical protein
MPVVALGLMTRLAPSISLGTLKLMINPAGHSVRCRYVRLRMKDRKQCGDGLDFDDDEILDNQIRAVVRIERRSFVDNGNDMLLDETRLALGQLPIQALKVDRFQQTWAKGAMHLDRRPENAPRDVVECRRIRRA